MAGRMNPDGCARGTRQNTHGVDLNRNFPSAWARIGRRGSYQWSGPHALSEPEWRYAVALVESLEPQITIWFHQHQGFVRAWGQSVATDQVAVRYSVELAEPPLSRDCVVRRRPAGRPCDARTHRIWVRAIRELAREGFAQ